MAALSKPKGIKSKLLVHRYGVALGGDRYSAKQQNFFSQSFPANAFKKTLFSCEREQKSGKLIPSFKVFFAAIVVV